MMYERTCKKCDKVFQSQKEDSTTCYGCALKHFAGNRAPEEGDFNSALSVSGEMSDQEARWLQEDLESVDHGGEEERQRSLCEDFYDEDDFDRWDCPEDRE